MATAANAQPDALEAFRSEVQDWLAANFPASLKGKGGAMTSPYGADSAGDDSLADDDGTGAADMGAADAPDGSDTGDEGAEPLRAAQLAVAGSVHAAVHTGIHPG